MSEQEKKALTPEEVVARKGDAALNRQGLPCDAPEATESRRAPYHAHTHALGSRPPLDITDDPTVVALRMPVTRPSKSEQG